MFVKLICHHQIAIETIIGANFVVNYKCQYLCFDINHNDYVTHVTLVWISKCLRAIAKRKTD